VKNKKTTVAGYMVLAASALNVLAAILGGGDASAAINDSLLPAIAGAGLVSAQDGGH